MTAFTKKIRLGCIADDFTGATDLANNLARGGMRVMQAIGVPDAPLDTEFDAVVIALKSRTNPVAQAVEQSLAALRWLQAQGAQQIYFKYCSTFDSTAHGNIGPVTEALMHALECPFTIATPAFPAGGRTVFKGYLFVGDMLLHESGMRQHPLTPMTDSNLVRVMQAQCQRKVGLIEHAVVARGSAAVQERMAQLQADGVAIAVVDAVSDDDLQRLASALVSLPLVTAASGLAAALPANFGCTSSSAASKLPAKKGQRRVILAGSCSQATQRQVKDFIARGWNAMELSTEAIAQAPQRLLSDVLNMLDGICLDVGPVLIYTTADHAALQEARSHFQGRDAGAEIERLMGQLACALVENCGVRQLIVAGGETSGACVQQLGISQLQIGPQITTGVPWCYGTTTFSDTPYALHLALKSGNFGEDDFFTRAFDMLP